jgi:TonB family protein
VKNACIAAVLLASVSALALEPVFTPPRLMEKVEAPYPEEAARAGLQGSVMLELIVDERGQVADAKVLVSAGHGFDEAALQAVRQFRFQPGLADGKPVPVKVTYRYAFVLKSAPPPPPTPAGAPPQPPPVRLRGLVVERGTRTPLQGIAVMVLDDQGEALGETETLADGSFALPLARGGAVQVVLASPAHKTLRMREYIGEHEALSVKYVLARTSYALYESTVRASVAREEVARVSLGGDEVLRIPGTKGDALAAVLNLPSVARSPFDLGLLVIRGSAPFESGAFLLGMAIPNPFHFGGLTSTFNSFLLDRFDLIPSNFSVRYGRLTGGIVDIVPREGKRDRLHGDLKVDIYDAHAIIEGPIGKGSFVLSARRSYIDAFLGLFTPNFTVAPRYYDYQGELDYPVAGGKLKILAFGSDDDLEFVNKTPPDTDPTLAGRFSTHQWFHTLLATYRRPFGARLDAEATIAVGPQHFDGDVGAAARFNLDLVEMDARAEVRYKVTPRFRLTGGLDVQTDYFWVSVNAPQQTTEDVPLGPLGERPQLVLRDHGFEASPALYVQGDLWVIANKLLVQPGVRADKLAGLNHLYVQPRLMSRWELARDTWLKAGVGLFHVPQMAPLSDPVLGNPRLRAEQAWHFTVGIEARPLPFFRALKLDLNLFYKDIQNVGVGSTDLTQRNGLIVPERYSDEGIGRVYGGDLLLKIDDGKKLYGWIAYTLLKSERKDHPNTPWRPFQYDETNILVLIIGYHFPLEFDVGARFRYVTGDPDTTAYSGILDADQNVSVPFYGATWAARLPDFLQLDLRVEKRFTFKSWILGVYIDVTNVTNHANVEGWAYSYDYAKRAPVTGLPIVPSLGVRASF